MNLPAVFRRLQSSGLVLGLQHLSPLTVLSLQFTHFLARDVIYTYRTYATMSVSVRLSVHLSVTEVHWRIVANLGFKFRSKFTMHCGRGEG